MAHCISPEISEFFNYPSSAVEVIVWEVSNPSNPCSSTRVERTLWYSPEANRYYTNSNQSSTYSGTFFSQDSTLGVYSVVTNGVLQDTTGNVCPLPPVIRWADMGKAASIDRYGNFLLAAYSDKHIVVKYDMSTGTNPVGTIVAGTNGVFQKALSSSEYELNLLNTPYLVKWREDGERFAVLSVGNMKSVKVFGKNGGYIWGPCEVSFQLGYRDYTWGQNRNSQGYATTAIESHGIVSDMIPGDSDMEKIWVPTKLDYYSGKNTSMGYGETIFIGLANRSRDRLLNRWMSNYRIYGVFRFYDDGFFRYVVTHPVYNFSLPLVHSDVPGNEVNDIIPDFCVMRKNDDVTNISTYDLAFIVPRSWSRSGNNQYRYYEHIELRVNVNYLQMSVNGTERYLPTRYIYDHAVDPPMYVDHVSASVHMSGNQLYVYVRSSDNGFWVYYMNASTTMQIAGTGMMIVSAVMLMYGVPGSEIVGAVGFVVLIIGAVTNWAIGSRKKYRRRDFGSSRLTVTFGSTNTYTYGVGNSSTNWRSSDHYEFTVFAHDRSGGTQTLLSLRTDGRVQEGNYNATNGTLKLIATVSELGDD